MPIRGLVNCYYHPNVEAIGVCKNCFKGICAESAVDIGDGIACRNRCEEQVRQYNRKLANATPGTWALASGLFGVAFIVLGAFLWTDDGFAKAWFPLSMASSSPLPELGRSWPPATGGRSPDEPA